MKIFFVKKDYDVVTNNEDAKVFQVITILDQEKNDLSGKFASGLFFKSDAELINYLKANMPLKAEEPVQIIEEF
jgi:hypothetical protein